jgi:hypothetical protein
LSSAVCAVAAWVQPSRPSLRKRAVTEGARGLLGAEPVRGRVAADICALHVQGDMQPLAERPGKRFVPVGLRAAQAMVQMEC